MSSIWVILLAVLAWGGLSFTGGPVSSARESVLRPAALVTDSSPPEGLAVLGGPNADGWYRTSTDYAWTAQDPESGVVSCDAGHIVPVDSEVPRTVYGTCVNGAGLTAAFGRFSYRFDGTPPTLDPVVTRSEVARLGIVVAQARGRDGLSGVARQSCNGNRALSTRRLGPHTVTCVVRDRAGNVATATVSYLVVERPPRRG